jgi:hypothetical protein
MKLKTLLICAFIFVFSSRGFGQDAIKENIKADAQKMLSAFKTNDYSILVKYTHPKIIDLMGGKEEAPKIIKQMMENVEGLESVEANNGEVLQLLDTGDEMQAVIPQLLVMKIQGRIFSSKNHLIGISSDKGMNWTFFDGNGFSEKAIREMFPNLSKDLVIPAKETSIK